MIDEVSIDFPLPEVTDAARCIQRISRFHLFEMFQRKSRQIEQQQRLLCNLIGRSKVNVSVSTKDTPASLPSMPQIMLHFHCLFNFVSLTTVIEIAQIDQNWMIEDTYVFCVPQLRVAQFLQMNEIAFTILIRLINTPLFKKYHLNVLFFLS